MASCTQAHLTLTSRQKDKRYISCLLRFEERDTYQRINILRYIFLDIYIFGICLKTKKLVQIVLETNRRERFFVVNAIFQTAPRVLCIRAVIETQAFSLISCSSERAVVISNRHMIHSHVKLSSMNIRMKQAPVHVLKFTELSLYVKCSCSCFAFIIQYGAMFFFSSLKVRIFSVGFCDQRQCY